MEDEELKGLSPSARSFYQKKKAKLREKERRLRRKVMVVDRYLQNMLSGLEAALKLALEGKGTFHGSPEATYKFREDWPGDTIVVDIEVITHHEPPDGEEWHCVDSSLVDEAFREFNEQHLAVPVKRKRIEIEYHLRVDDESGCSDEYLCI